MWRRLLTRMPHPTSRRSPLTFTPQMSIKGNRDGRLLMCDPISDPCADGLQCTAADDDTTDARISSPVVDACGLSSTACSNLKNRCRESGVGVRVPPAYHLESSDLSSHACCSL